MLIFFYFFVGRFYKYAMVEVKRTQDKIHKKLVADVMKLEEGMSGMFIAEKYTGGKNYIPDIAFVAPLTEFVNTRADYVVKEWQDLLPRLITQYV